MATLLLSNNHADDVYYLGKFLTITWVVIMMLLDSVVILLFNSYFSVITCKMRFYDNIIVNYHSAKCLVLYVMYDVITRVLVPSQFV